jgi:hypothetical protein
MNEYPGNRLPGGRSLVNARGMHANFQYQMVRSALGFQVPAPSVGEGIQVQRVLAAAYRSAHENCSIEIEGLIDLVPGQKISLLGTQQAY